MSTSAPVVALVPCYNCSGRVGATVAALMAAEEVDRVIVIDDASSDGSGAEAERAGALVVSLPVNSGKGAALQRGVEESADAGAYLLVDADTAATASGALPLLAPVIDGRADLTVGVLPSAGGRGGFGAVKNFSIWGIRKACGLQTLAPLSGQRAVDARILRDLALERRFGVEVGMTIDAVRAGARVLEVPVVMDHEHRGKSLSGFAHRGKQGRDVARALWPRLVPKQFTWVVTALLAVLIVVAAVLVSGVRSEPEGRSLPRVGEVDVIAAPGLRWDRAGSVPDAIAAASMVTGRTDDVAAALASGTREPGARPLIEVQTLDSKAASEIEARLASAGRDRVVIVAGTSVDGDETLRPLLVSGAGMSGELWSPSTHREALADVGDVAATALALQGKPVTSQVDGSPLRYEPAKKVDAAEQEKQAEAISNGDRWAPFVIAGYVVAQLALFSTLFRRLGGRLLLLARRSAIAVTAFPIAAFLAEGALDHPGLLAWSALVALLVGMIVFVVGALSSDPLGAIRRAILLMLVVLTVDALTGTNLQFGGVFGSSPLLGARYFGFGNPATTLFLCGLVVWACLHVKASSNRAASIRRALLAGVAAAVMVGLPGLGADAGGLLVAVLLLAGLPLALSGRRPSVAAVGGIAIAGAVMTALVAFLDSLRAASEQTHLGRFAQSVLDGGVGRVLDFVQERVELNLLGYGFPFTLVLIAAFVAVVIALLSGRVTQFLPLGSFERTAVSGGLITAFLLFCVNDSGIVVLVLPAVFLVPLLVVMRENRERIVSREVSV